MAQRAMAFGARSAVRAAAATPAVAASTCGRVAAPRLMLLRRAAARWDAGPERALGSHPSGGRRQIHSSSVARKDAKPAEDAATPADAEDPKEPTPFEKEIAEAEKRPGPDGKPEPLPGWQNPRHHNDPQLRKVFFEDFEEGEKPELIPLPPFSDGSGKVNASQELHDIAEEIVSMNMLEVKDLVDRIGKHFGLEEVMIGGGPPQAGAGGGGAEGDAEEEKKEEEKTAFDLKLTGFDAKAKIKVIKEVRAAAGLGLKEAKELVEGAPKTIMKDIKKEEAEELKAKLEEVGATVEIV